MPFKYEKSRRKFILDPIKCLYSAVITGAFAFGIVHAVMRSKENKDNISKISNLMQIAVNSVAVLVTLIYPTVKFSRFQDVIAKFGKIDSKLEAIGSFVNYDSDLKKFAVYYFMFGIYMITYLAYSCYAVTTQSKVPVWYWMTTCTPLAIYGFGLLKSNSIIAFLCQRCNCVTDIITKLSDTYERQIKLKSGKRNGKQPRDTDLVAIIPLAESESNFTEVQSTVSEIVNDICDLTHDLESLFGPLYLTSFAAIFAVTTIQSYYIIVIAVYSATMKNASAAGFNSIALMELVLIVITNVMLIVVSTTICEKVSSNTMNIINSLSKLQVNIQKATDQDNKTIWLHPLLSELKFTAFGFFGIDTSMLFSFFVGLLTYLLILVQFKGLTENSPDSGGSAAGSSGNTEKEKEAEQGMFHSPKWGNEREKI